MLRNLRVSAFAVLLTTSFVISTAARAVDPVKAGISVSANVSLDDFWRLYKAKDYAGAASVFETLMSSSRPGATAYYYAALANQQVYKQKRANQLFNYIVTAFPGTTEATYAKKAIDASGGVAEAKKAADDDELPESVKAQLSPEMQLLLKTPEGKKIVAQSLKEQGDSVKVIKDAEKKGIIQPAKVAAVAAASANSDTERAPIAKAAGVKPVAHKLGDHPFTPDQIAKEGPNGIDQTNAPNCWFESAMSALAQLPRGQKAIAQMITYGEGDSYLVRFPGDGVEYKITKDDLESSGVNNKALWASLLDYAERCKFPNNIGASGPNEDKHRLQVGLGCITGCNAEMIYPTQTNKETISSFIYGAVSSHNPVTCATSGRDRSIPAPIIESHAYTIIGFDSTKNMVTLRNPHGKKSQRFSVAGDPAHLRFEQLDDGVFKMNLDLFCVSFGSVCRSFM